jgi:transcriptional regulator with XRE-family HTH domain
MPGKRGPSVRARRLALELRRLREASTLTGDQAAARLGWSPSKISRIETGSTAVTAGDLQRLFDLYEVPGQLRERLAELARAAREYERGWWDAYADTLGEGYSTMIALEADAQSERQYDPLLVPGLLQTEAYAEEIIRSALLFAPLAPPGEVPRRLLVRTTRQRILTRDNPIEYVVVLDEAVLRRHVGSPEVMREQLSHLVEMAGRPNISLQILPFETGPHPAMTGGFTILTFPEAIAPDVVYVESMTSELFMENETEVYRHNLAFNHLRELALQQQESIDLINHIAVEINRHSEGRDL